MVVGGGSGIGEATARELASTGWRVAILDINTDQAAAVAADLGASHFNLACDVRSTAEVRGAIDGAAAVLGSIDALVACHGIVRPGAVDTLSDDDLLTMVDIHLIGTIRCARAAFRYLREAPRPAIATMSSVGAHLGIPHRLSYCAAKGGIEAAVKTLAVEWAPYGIRANAVAAAWVLTPATKRLIDDDVIDVADLESRIPLERLATPAEIARVLAFLVSPAASYITGQAVLVDGGLTIQGPWPHSVERPGMRKIKQLDG